MHLKEATRWFKGFVLASCTLFIIGLLTGLKNLPIMEDKAIFIVLSANFFLLFGLSVWLFVLFQTKNN